LKKGNGKAQVQFVSRAKDDFSTGRYRNQFMRDRDRILYSKAFRRLSRKTQVFLPASDDHVRTRLTHSLEVAQISTISAQALGLDRDLTEAIALGHDIGHTPFGHTGERILNLIAINCDKLSSLSPQLNINSMGFKHNLQGIRVTADLDKLYQDFSGLNLSNFTLWGMQNHTSKVWKKCGYRQKGKESQLYICNNPQNRKDPSCIHGNNHAVLENQFYDKYNDFLRLKTKNGYGYYAWSFEGLLVELADEIAQRHHDIEDGLIARVIQSTDILDWINELIKPYFNKEENKIFKNLNSSTEKKYIRPKISKLIVGCLNRNLITNSKSNLDAFYKHYSINSKRDFSAIYPDLRLDGEFTSQLGKIQIKDIISYPTGLKSDENILKEKLRNGILNSYQVQRMDGKAQFIIRQLAKAYLSNPQQLLDNTIEQLFLSCYPDKTVIPGTSINERREWLNAMYYSANIDIKKQLIRVICDYISSMTDDFAISEHARLYSTVENKQY
jgi:dGTPase